jgi:hypothetical protein
MKIELKTILEIIDTKTSWGKEQLKQAILEALAREGE